jgi:PAS domain S-box-containing protein
MPKATTVVLKQALLAVVLLAAARASEADAQAVSQALIWLPSGIAIAGLWLLGLRAVWAVALATFVNRIGIGYDASCYVPAMLGSSAEAIVGVLLLRRLQVRGDFGDLSEVLRFATAAAAAPVASILFSAVGRSMPGNFADLPFYCRWDGWWTMNVLGVLTVVPPVLLWFNPARRRDPRVLLEIGLTGGSTIVTLAAVTLLMAPGVPGVLLMSTVLLIALLAAIWQGPLGAATNATIAAITIVTFAAEGVGPFLIVPYAERHMAAQIGAFLVVTVPLVFGALIAEREKNVHRWLDSEGMRKALIRVLPDAVYRLGPDDTFRDIMVPEGTRMPVPTEQLLGRRLQDVASREHAEAILAQVANAREGRRSIPVEYPLHTPAGTFFREVRFVPLDDGEVLGVVRDVTSRRLAEHQVAWHTAVLERIASGSPLADVLLVIVHGIEQFLDARASLQVVRGRKLYVACAPSLPPEFHRCASGLDIGPEEGCCGAAAHFDTVVVAADTRVDPRWSRWRDEAAALQLIACWSMPVHATDGTVLGTFAVYHAHVHEPSPADLALLQRAAILTGLALEREQREGLLASIQENVSEGLFRTVPDAGLVHVNPACATLFGYESPAAMLKDAGKATDESHRECLRWLGDAEATTRLEERRLHRRDGSPFWALVSRTVVRDEQGVVTSCDGAITDVTVSRQLSEQLRQSHKMEAVGQLAGGVAHDFNNLLTAISGYAESVRDGLPAGDALRQDAVEIVRAAARAAELTRQLLAFGRRQVLSLQVLDLRTAIDGMVGMLRRLLGERIQVDTQPCERAACARVDRAQLEQIVLNLALNARDAMPDGGRVVIGTDVITVGDSGERPHADLHAGDYALLWVADDGVGMAPAVRERAFEPFFTTKPQGQGTGLGLATVYGTVKQSGGAARIDSAPGKGTKVSVYLPLVAAMPTLPAEPVVELPRPSGRRAVVLVAEDEALVRELVQRALLRAGHDVLAAANGEEALALAEAHAFDVLVTDVVMPHLGGRELALRLASSHSATPILFMSGYASEGEQLIAAASGRGAILNKPFTANQLVRAVEALLAPAAAIAQPKS